MKRVTSADSMNGSVVSTFPQTPKSERGLSGLFSPLFRSDIEILQSKIQLVKEKITKYEQQYLELKESKNLSKVEKRIRKIDAKLTNAQNKVVKLGQQLEERQRKFNLKNPVVELSTMIKAESFDDENLKVNDDYLDLTPLLRNNHEENVREESQESGSNSLESLVLIENKPSDN